MLLQSIARFIETNRLLDPGAPALVGVSGGVDSVVLLHVLQRSGFAVQAAHVNYRLRGASSDADEAFVRRCCAAWRVPLHVETLDAAHRAAVLGQSLQEAARDLRYDSFRRLGEEHGLPYVAVAHHLDDQVETVLLHLLRGTGPEGLAGMPARRPIRADSRVVLIRPLLGVRRTDVLAYARAEGLSWREDASNTGSTYRRGVIREEVLPLLEGHFGASVAENVARSAALVRAYVEEAMRPELATYWQRLATTEDDGGALDVEGLRALPPIWRGRLILEAHRRWLPQAPQSAAFIDAVEALLGAQVGRHVEASGGRVWRERTRLFFVRSLPGADGPEELTIDSPGEAGAMAGGTMAIDRLARRPERLDGEDPYVEIVDADRLTFPLTVRRWRPGDRVQPLGMTGSKTVSDLLTDLQVPSHRRSQVLVVLSDGEVIWVVGHRLAHGVRVRGDTARFAKISFNRRD